MKSDKVSALPFVVFSGYCCLGREEWCLISWTPVGIKEYSNWPTIPQLYVNKEFIGGCDILVSMHQSGELTDLLYKEKVLVPSPEDED